jgi:hypothetical protein
MLDGHHQPRKRLSDAIPSNIKTACRSIGYAAFVDHPDGWDRLDVILARELRPELNGEIAMAAIRALPPNARAAFIAEIAGVDQ